MTAHYLRTQPQMQKRERKILGLLNCVVTARHRKPVQAEPI